MPSSGAGKVRKLQRELPVASEWLQRQSREVVGGICRRLPASCQATVPMKVRCPPWPLAAAEESAYLGAAASLPSFVEGRALACMEPRTALIESTHRARVKPFSAERAPARWEGPGYPCCWAAGLPGVQAVPEGRENEATGYCSVLLFPPTPPS